MNKTKMKKSESELSDLEIQKSKEDLESEFEEDLESEFEEELESEISDSDSDLEFEEKSEVQKVIIISKKCKTTITKNNVKTIKKTTKIVKKQRPRSRKNAKPPSYIT